VGEWVIRYAREGPGGGANCEIDLGGRKKGGGVHQGWVTVGRFLSRIEESMLL